MTTGKCASCLFREKDKCVWLGLGFTPVSVSTGRKDQKTGHMIVEERYIPLCGGVHRMEMALPE